MKFAIICSPLLVSAILLLELGHESEALVCTDARHNTNLFFDYYRPKNENEIAKASERLCGEKKSNERLAACWIAYKMYIEAVAPEIPSELTFEESKEGCVFETLHFQTSSFKKGRSKTVPTNDDGTSKVDVTITVPMYKCNIHPDDWTTAARDSFYICAGVKKKGDYFMLESAYPEDELYLWVYVDDVSP